ncbi:hypothetical protein HCN44_007062 [Aphidius gifuensis]|uniref:Major facilitator superfamily (MFS) profile domain-containing protein n=1 Tax=Aphidius gifuensis TaxID=684658 RepID=A0A834XKW7_APHGI|nr:facilitated trehalose transporter Tret1-like [Aphidius gifuensis]KAF7988752.1 hypothetical protein HCN44_007062 [Aphidius gifuensis]
MVFNEFFLLNGNRRHQWIAIGETFLISIVMGMVSGWTSPSLAQLSGPDSPIPIDPHQAQWIVSLLIIGRIIGFVITLITTQYIGSKKILFLVGVIEAFGLLCLAIANSILWIYLSRFICGISFGMFTMTFPVYIGEISSPKIRGTMVCFVASGLTVGFLFGSIIAAYKTILFSLLALGINLIFVGSFYWQPETPYHLVKIDKIIEAEVSIKHYQCDVCNVKNEIESLKIFINAKDTYTYYDMFRELMISHNRQALINLNIFHILSALSGSFTVIFYLQILLTDARVTIINPADTVIALTTIGLVGEIMAVFVGDKLGRKVLLSVSNIGIGIAFIGIASHFLLLNYGYEPTNLQWLPIIATVLFTIFINFGLVSVPSIILSELFAPNVKTISVFICNIIGSLAAFLSSFTYDLLLSNIGYNLYFYFAFIIIIATLFVIIFLPETRGKSLQDIQEMLQNKL